MVEHKADLIGKKEKVKILIDPVALKLVLNAAERAVKYMVEHDMLLHGNLFCETEEFKAGLEEFKRAISNETNDKKIVEKVSV